MKLLSKISSSIKEKLELALATSKFESVLYSATSNSLSNQPTTKDKYMIADHTFVYDDLITILARIKHRLQSAQKKK